MRWAYIAIIMFLAIPNLTGNAIRKNLECRIANRINEKYVDSNAPNIYPELLGAMSVVDEQFVDIILHIIYIESRFNPETISITNDYGLMQINKKYWNAKYDFNRMFSPQYNIMAGYEIFLLCYNKADGNMYRALTYYNGSEKYAKLVLSTL